VLKRDKRLRKRRKSGNRKEEERKTGEKIRGKSIRQTPTATWGFPLPGFYKREINWGGAGRSKKKGMNESEETGKPGDKVPTGAESLV